MILREQRQRRIPKKAYSPKTSRKQKAGLFRIVAEKHGWVPGTINADIGGGRYDISTEFLKPLGVKNLIWDPGWRSKEWNEKVLDRVADGGADTATVANVLNVIPDKETRADVIALAANVIKPGGVAYFQIYEGDKSGKGKPTSDGWQENRKLKTYVPEIEKYFDEVDVYGDHVQARNS